MWEKNLDPEVSAKAVNNQILLLLESKADPNILAGIFNINISQVYAARREGKLPANLNSSYRQCIDHYVTYFKNRALAKGGSIAEAKMIQEMKLTAAKEELAWIEVAKAKGELVSKVELFELLSPIIGVLRATFINIARQFPEAASAIDRALSGLSSLGEILVDKAAKEESEFLSTQKESINQTIEEAEEAVKTAFDLDLSELRHGKH